MSHGPRARCLPPALVAGGSAIPTLASPGTPLTAAALLVPWRGLGRGTATLHRRVAEGPRVPKGVYWLPGTAGPGEHSRIQ